MAVIQLSQDELNERIAILKRYRTLLEQQRDKFRDYLSVLEKQSAAISQDDAGRIAAHTEIERQLVENLANLQRVISPMEKLYEERSRTAAPLLNGAGDSSYVIPELRSELDRLREQVLNQNRQNQDQLRERMIELKPRMDGFKNPYSKASSIYAHQNQVAQLVSVNS